jgi:hypothetical protein
MIDTNSGRWRVLTGERKRNRPRPGEESPGHAALMAAAQNGFALHSIFPGMGLDGQQPFPIPPEFLQTLQQQGSDLLAAGATTASTPNGEGHEAVTENNDVNLEEQQLAQQQATPAPRKRGRKPKADKVNAAEESESEIAQELLKLSDKQEGDADAVAEDLAGDDEPEHKKAKKGKRTQRK